MIKKLLAFFARPRAPFTSTGLRYSIGGVTYVQHPLVLLQVEQLSDFLTNIQLRPDLNVVGIVRALGDQVADALAIVLTPEGTELDAKDLAAIAAHLRKSVDIAMAVLVVEDFLSCNPVGSVFDKLTAAIGMCSNFLVGSGSPSSSAFSQPET